MTKFKVVKRGPTYGIVNINIGKDVKVNPDEYFRGHIEKMEMVAKCLNNGNLKSRGIYGSRWIR